MLWRTEEERFCATVSKRLHWPSSLMRICSRESVTPMAREKSSMR